MAVRNLEIRKKGEGFSILEQAGSNYHLDQPVHESPSRKEANDWLKQQGAGAEQVERALNDASQSERSYVEIAGDYSEGEDFPKR